MTKRSRFFLGLLLVLLATIGIAGYYAYETFFNQILEESAVTQVKVEVLSDAHPVQLRITVKSVNSGQDIRTVTATRHGESLNVRYHLAVAGLVKPQQDWHKPYSLTVPDSVNQVTFGRGSQVIWRRGTR